MAELEPHTRQQCISTCIWIPHRPSHTTFISGGTTLVSPRNSLVSSSPCSILLPSGPSKMHLEQVERLFPRDTNGGRYYIRVNFRGVLESARTLRRIEKSPGTNARESKPSNYICAAPSLPAILFNTLASRTKLCLIISFSSMTSNSPLPS